MSVCTLDGPLSQARCLTHLRVKAIYRRERSIVAVCVNCRRGGEHELVFHAGARSATPTTFVAKLAVRRSDGAHDRAKEGGVRLPGSAHLLNGKLVRLSAHVPSGVFFSPQSAAPSWWRRRARILHISGPIWHRDPSGVCDEGSGAAGRAAAGRRPRGSRLQRHRDVQQSLLGASPRAASRCPSMSFMGRVRAYDAPWGRSLSLWSDT